jgi:hypothetical protein
MQISFRYRLYRADRIAHLIRTGEWPDGICSSITVMCPCLSPHCVAGSVAGNSQVNAVDRRLVNQEAAGAHVDGGVFYPFSKSVPLALIHQCAARTHIDSQVVAFAAVENTKGATEYDPPLMLKWAKAVPCEVTGLPPMRSTSPITELLIFNVASWSSAGKLQPSQMRMLDATRADTAGDALLPAAVGRRRAADASVLRRAGDADGGRRAIVLQRCVPFDLRGAVEMLVY